MNAGEKIGSLEEETCYIIVHSMRIFQVPECTVEINIYWSTNQCSNVAIIYSGGISELNSLNIKVTKIGSLLYPSLIPLRGLYKNRCILETNSGLS